MHIRCPARTVATALMFAAMSAASAQSYPAKPLRIVASERGGGNDFAAREVAQGLAARLGQPVIVQNKQGGTSSGETVLSAQRDGYSVLSAGSQFWVEPLWQKTPYDVVKDFTPITVATSVPFFLFVNSSVPANSIKELIALAKSRPGQLKYASGGSGSSNHLASELLKSMAGIDILRTPYSGGAAAVNGTAAGEVQLVFASANAAAGHVKAGRLKPLAVASARPSALMPGVSPVAETLPGYETLQVYGFLAAAGTPSAVIRRLNQEMVAVLNAPEAKQRFLAAGVEVVANTPEEFAALIKVETARWSKLLKDAGIRIE